MNWSDDPVLKLESLGQFLTPEERASLLEAENRALREKLSVSEEAIAFLQSHLMTRESRSLQAEGQGRELAELWAAQSAVDERLQTLQDSQTGLVALFRREHERLTQAVNQEAARYLSNTLADSERALADAYARAPQLLLRGLADGNPRAFDEARRLVAEAQARSSEARRAAQESLENRLMTLQDSVTNLLTLFEREVDMMVSDVRSDLAASLPSAYNRRVTERSTAGRQIAGIRPLAQPPNLKRKPVSKQPWPTKNLLAKRLPNPRLRPRRRLHPRPSRQKPAQKHPVRPNHLPRKPLCPACRRLPKSPPNRSQPENSPVRLAKNRSPPRG